MPTGNTIRSLRGIFDGTFSPASAINTATAVNLGRLVTEVDLELRQILREIGVPRHPMFDIQEKFDIDYEDNE